MSQNLKAAMSLFVNSGYILLFLSFIRLARSLECYQCNDFSTSYNHSVYDPYCKTLDLNETISDSHLLMPCAEPKVKTTEKELIPVCITLEYQVLQTYSWNAGDVEYSKEMTKPSYRRMCGYATKGSSEIETCLSRGNAAVKVSQCICSENACNNKKFGSTSYLWIYLLTILVSTVAVGGVSYTIYRKTGCNFDK